MVWVGVAIGTAFVLLFVFGLGRGLAFNHDPIVRELSIQMSLIVLDGKMPAKDIPIFIKDLDGNRIPNPDYPLPVNQGWSNVKDWLVSVTPQASGRHRKAMARHALAMIQFTLDSFDHRLLAHFIDNWDGSKSV